MNIKNILTLKFTGIVASILFCFSIFTYQFSFIFRESEFNDRLKEHATRNLHMLIDRNEVDSNILKIAYTYGINALPHQRLVIFKNDSIRYFTSHSNVIGTEEQILLELRQNHLDVNYSAADTDYVAFEYRLNNDKFDVIASAVDVVGYEKINTLKYTLIVLFLVSLIITGLSGKFFARQALKPISDVVSDVDNITAFNLHERVNEGNGKDEIAQLAITFNKMLERLENSFVLQKTFVANASHEFRTPLTVMKGQIEVLLLQARSSEEYVQTLRSLIDDINNQIDLLNGLTGLAQANADFPNIAFERVPIPELVLDARDELIRNKPHFRVQVHFHQVPEQEEMLSIKGSQTLLKSALINLMDNACKFSVNRSCDVNIEFEPESIVIGIRDEGVGISAEDLKHIFEPFYRANNTRTIAGHGIGLSLTQKIAEWHHGNIQVESEEGKGTSITLSFPGVGSNG